MKVLHLISGGDTGGAKTHVLSLVDALTDKISVQLICLTPGEFYHEARQMGLPVVLMKQKKRWDLSVVSDLVRMLTENGGDILHCHGARANFLAALARRHVSVPVVTTLHSDYLRDFEDNLYKHLTYTPLNRLSLRRLDYFIAVTDDFRQMLVRRRFDPERIFTVYNGIRFEQVARPQLTRQQFRKRWNIPVNAPLVITVGRMARVKRQDVLLEAAAQLQQAEQEIHFLLVGDGPRRDQLRRQVRNLSLQERVHFTGYLDDVESALNASDIAVLTSESESFPYALLEAARRRLPVVSTPVGGIPEMIRDGDTGFLSPVGDPDRLSENLSRLLSSTELRQKLGENLYRHTRSSFSLQSMRDHHLNIYQQILPRQQEELQSEKAAVSPATRQRSVVISGYFGFGNTGDEALLRGMIASLRDRHQNLRITVLSADPEQTEKLHDAGAVNRFSPGALFSALRDAELFLSGGGTLLQDETSLRSLFYYAGVIELARIAGARVMLYANGLGPLNTRLARRLARRCLSLADAVTLRDHQSLQTAGQLLGGSSSSADTMTVTADPAFCLKPAPSDEVNALFSRCGIPDKESLAVISLRPWSLATQRVARAAAAADRLLRDEGLFPVYLPMQPQFDTAVCHQASRLAGTDSPVITTQVQPGLAMAVMSRAEITVGMRLHALIMSAAAGVPVVGLSYDPKIEGFLNEVNGFCAGRVEKITEERLTDVLRKDVLPHLCQLQRDMKKMACKMRQKSGKNSKLALSLLDTGNRARR